MRWSSVFLKPRFICAALCGVTAYATNGLLNRIFPADTSKSILNMGTVSALIAIALAAIVHLISLIKGIAKKTFLSFPREKNCKVL